MTNSRLEEITENVSKVTNQIHEACKKVNRDPGEITLIAVTKTYPSSDVEILATLGIKDVGENKDQEASLKFEQVKSQLNWHFVGQLQSNKVKSVVSYANLIHSLDRLSLVKEIQKQAQKINKIQSVLIQIDLDESGDDENRGGVSVADLNSLATQISQSSNLELKGLMSVAPLNSKPEIAFDRLRDIQSQFLRQFPNAQILSAGMSEDFEVAIAYGATHLRIGSGLLGERPQIG